MITFIVHTNSDYYDVLELFLESSKKFELEKDFNFVFCSNKEIPGYKTHVYFTMTSYEKRILDTITYISDDYIGLLHEDFIPIGKPDISKIEGSLAILKESKKDFLRLIRSDDVIINPYKDNLYRTGKFAIQATIFKKRYLINYLGNFPDSSIWDLEKKSKYFDTEGLFYFDNEPLRGLVHHDSSIFPYMATAIVKGKWNTEYRKELLELRSEKLFSIRGWT